MLTFCFFFYFLSLNNSATVSGRPEYVSSDLDSVYMTWISSQSLNYTVQMWNNKTWSWETARCYESKAAGSCVVVAPRATVVGLTSSSTYFFRIIVDNTTISATSKPMKTKQHGELIRYQLQMATLSYSPGIFLHSARLVLNPTFIPKQSRCIENIVLVSPFPRSNWIIRKECL